MPAVVICDLSFGDSGKGKLSDILAENAWATVRYNGGNNAGHTIVIDGKKYVTHILPSGALRPKSISVITPGVLIDTATLKEDIKNTGLLEDKSRQLIIDPRCPVITEDHINIDGGDGLTRIGTTGRGIGPCMADQINRIGKRYGDIYPGSVIDTSEFLYHGLKRGKTVIFEGAQGFSLDLWHGTYPYVTSSCTTVGAVCTNAGIPPQMIDSVWGVMKAYTTRVGKGPFLTEEFGQVAEYIRDEGREFGATTGRPRRIGWLDLVETKRAARINGVNWLALMKSDILSDLSSFPVCIDRDLRGRPIYKEIEGWQCPISHIEKYRDLPDEFKEFIAFVERAVCLPISLISVGPERHQTIEMV